MESEVGEVGEFAVEEDCRGDVGEELPEPVMATMFAFTVAPVD
jgi:hypothetical protein